MKYLMILYFIWLQYKTLELIHRIFKNKPLYRLSMYTMEVDEKDSKFAIVLSCILIPIELCFFADYLF